MANSVNVFTFIFTASEINKAFPENTYSYILVKCDLNPTTINGKDYPTIIVSMEAYTKDENGKSPKKTAKPVVISGCPVPPCIPPTGIHSDDDCLQKAENLVLVTQSLLL